MATGARAKIHHLMAFAAAGLTFVFASNIAASAAAPVKKGAAAKPAARQAPGIPAPVINAYLGRLRGRILPNWNLPDGKNHVVLTVKVEPDGQVTDLKAQSSPSNTQAEQASQDAFNRAQPLEALPAGTAGATITLTFESNADPHGDTSSNLLTRFDVVPKPAAPAANGAQ
jgi:TonB family protein